MVYIKTIYFFTRTKYSELNFNNGGFANNTIFEHQRTQFLNKTDLIKCNPVKIIVKG
jgi:hypothetical protein